MSLKFDILIIRFSSFGDIVQCMGALSNITPPDTSFNDVRIHFITLDKFASILRLSPYIYKIWDFKRSSGFIGLLSFIYYIHKNQRFDCIYDAHNNLRSFFVRNILFVLSLGKIKIIKRDKYRIKRLLLFKFRYNLFPSPFRGIESYRLPLYKNGLIEGKFTYQTWNFPNKPNTYDFRNYIVLVPSATWSMKRWPVLYWMDLVKKLADKKFLILGAKEDHFCQDIADIDKDRTINMAGKLSLEESCEVVSRSKFIISADTGLIHVADLLGKEGIILMGPTAFGFPTGDRVEVLSANLPCRPCSKDGRGGCTQKVWQKCMVDIEPSSVADIVIKRV